MRKIFAILLVMILTFGLIACKSESVTLHCDGANCDNVIVVKGEEARKFDDSWLIFCKDCEDIISIE